MKKAFLGTMTIFWVCFIAFSVTLPYANGSNSAVSFSDHFNGSQVDNLRWVVQENTDMSGLPAFGGSVKVSNSNVALASTGDGTSFPCVTSAFNPFPSTSDFVVEFDLTYDCLSDWGSGLWISKGSFGDDKDSADIVFQVWGDNEASWTQSALRAYFFGTEVYRSEVPGWEPSAATHAFKLECVEETYTVFVDTVEVATGSSAIRPDSLGFGHPPSRGIPFEHERAIGNVGGWSSFRIDLIKVLPPAIVSLSPSNSLVDFGSAIDIMGSLRTKEGTPLIGETVILSYMIPAVGNWNPVTSAVTDHDGAYVASWFPAATGTFGLKVEWPGNGYFAGNHQVSNVSVVSKKESDEFSAELNSTLSENSIFPTGNTAVPGLFTPWVLLAVALTIASVGLLVHIVEHSRD